MLTAKRSLALSSEAGRELPRVPELEALYAANVVPRQGQTIMIVGRSGAQKSGFALWWLSRMNLPTLYFSADMSPFTASARLASMHTGFTTDEVGEALDEGGVRAAKVLDALSDSQISFSFGSPITWRSINNELEAYTEAYNAYPAVLVFDNLMDFEGGEADYALQMENMQLLTELSRETGATVLIMHHASDKSWSAQQDPWIPPTRPDIKNGMSEKPELTLSVSIEERTNVFRIACLKQRMGPSSPMATNFTRMQAIPELTRFMPYRSV